MAVTRVKTWSSNEILYASDLNGEFNNLINNGTDVAFPLTKAVSGAGYALTNIGNTTFSSGAIVTMTAGVVYLAKGADIASASALALGTDGNYFDVTGTTTIASMTTRQAGTVIWLQFDGALTITYNATSMILINSVDYVTTAGDVIGFVSEGSGNWRMISLMPRAGVGPRDAQYLTLATNSVLTVERVFVPRDCLDGTDAGAGGNYSVDWNPVDATVGWVSDDFISGTLSSGGIGALGWIAGDIGAAATLAKANGTIPNIGLFTAATTATSTQGTSISLSSASAEEPLGNLAGTTDWALEWVFKIDSATNVRLRIGLGMQYTVAEPTDGMWLRYDTNATYGDTAFQFVTRAASTNTATSTAISGDTAYHRLRIASTTAGTIVFTLYDAAGAQQATASHTANVPTAGMTPLAIIVTDTSAAKTLTLDYFSFRIRGLVR